ncbi:hypothetical protein [Demequina oxidasica]|uniref:hypothetical protein n=1 Tax=Demequina oxidasica TaxID=676199 RepID=UPI0007840918|nr:hypothetical protein [Demequina oxidasica]
MSPKPSYITHSVEESDVTVDWFFGSASVAVKARQVALVSVSWFFALLPICLTTWALVHRNDPDSPWARYTDWFNIWQIMMTVIAALIAFFAIAFLLMFLLNRSDMRKRNVRETYNVERLDRRVAIAADWYSERYGDKSERIDESRVIVLPGSNIGTYELRELYAKNEVG